VARRSSAIAWSYAFFLFVRLTKHEVRKHNLNLMSFSEDRKTKIWSVVRVSSGNFLEMPMRINTAGVRDSF